MRFIADALQQIQALAVACQDQRIRFGRYPDFLQPFSQSDHRDVGDAEFVEHRARGIDLSGATVDHVEVRRVGEPAGLVGGLGLLGRGVLQVTLEPSASDLRDGGHVVGAALACGLTNREVAVVGFARQAVFENHQRPHHIGALHMADVDAFDPQRRIGQAE